MDVNYSDGAEFGGALHSRTAGHLGENVPARLRRRIRQRFDIPTIEAAKQLALSPWQSNHSRLLCGCV